MAHYRKFKGKKTNHTDNKSSGAANDRFVGKASHSSNQISKSSEPPTPEAMHEMELYEESESRSKYHAYPHINRYQPGTFTLPNESQPISVFLVTLRNNFT